MIKATIKCLKYPDICSRQTGRSNLYCDGKVECSDQVAVLEECAPIAQHDASRSSSKLKETTKICPECKGEKKLWNHVDGCYYPCYNCKSLGKLRLT